MTAPEFATVSEVKHYLGITVNTDDAQLALLVLGASAWIEQYCSRRFLAATYTERRDAWGGTSLMLANRPVVGVTSVLWGAPGQSPATLVFNTDYYFTEFGLQFLRAMRGRGSLLVTYTAGYSVVPWDIKQCCIELVAWRYKESKRIGQRSVSVGPQETVSFLTSATSASTKQALDQWKNPVPL